MIAYRLHFERATLAALEIAQRGDLGDLRYFSSEFSMSVADGNVRLERDLGGGPLQDVGVYCINAARALFDAEPEQVWAVAASHGGEKFSEVPATVAATLRFPGGRFASFTCSFDAGDRSVYTIAGTSGSLTMEPAYAYAEGLAYQVRTGTRTRKRRLAKSDQFAPELVYFSDCVREGRDPEPSGTEGQADVRVIEALERSLATGQPVALPALRRPPRRPSLSQERRRPPVPKPPTVHVRPPH
jgi:glucose-fructose oxidoreductase